MAVALSIAEPTPEDWPRRARVKAMLRQAEERGLRETLMMHALSMYGAYIWSLDDGQLDDLTATFGAVFSLLDEQLDTRSVH